MEERLVRNEQTNELHLPLSFTIVLEGRKQMLYVPLDFENGLAKDALVDSRAYVCAIAQNLIGQSQTTNPSQRLQKQRPSHFRKKVANGQLDKPLVTTALKFDIRDTTFAEHFVVLRNLTGPIIGLHFMRHSSGVIETRQGLMLFQHLRMQVKSAASKTNPNHNLSSLTTL